MWDKGLFVPPFQIPVVPISISKCMLAFRLLQSLPLKLGITQESTLPILIQIHLEVLARATRRLKEIKKM